MVIKNTKQDLITDLNNIDMDDFSKVELLAKNFVEWCKWNKGLDYDIEVIRPKKFVNTFVVIHNLFDHNKICEDAWEFLEDVVYLIGEYVDTREDDFEYCSDFWASKFVELLA